MSFTTEDRVLFMGLREAMRFSIWISLVERPDSITPERWEELLKAPAWIGEFELAACMDALYPTGVQAVLTTFPEREEAHIT